MRGEGPPPRGSKLKNLLADADIRIEDPEEARELIQQMLSEGKRPIVTIDKKYLEDVKKDGLIPQKSWTGHDLLIGTLGREPYKLDKGRVAVEVLVDNPDLINPRFTGEEKYFQGVVEIATEVPPDKLRIIDNLTA